MRLEDLDPHMRSLYRFAHKNGYQKNQFLTRRTCADFISTAVDAYQDYPMFLQVFNYHYDEKTFTRMLNVDFKSRMESLAGIASSENFESVVLIESPAAKKVGMKQYIKTADLNGLMLLLKPSLSRLEKFEHFAEKERSPWMDGNTWYLYIFATRTDRQGQGHGKKLLKLLLDYSKYSKERICLETNLDSNVPMYEHFGFQTMAATEYKDHLKHYVMLYS